MTRIMILAVVVAAIIVLVQIQRKRFAKPQFRTTDEMMQFLAAEAVDVADKDYHIKLDYSTESIKKVEEVLSKLHEEYTSEKNKEFQGLAMAFGAYIGEAIRREEPDSKWSQDHPVGGEKSYPLYWLGGDSFPCGWCYKRIVNGSEDNVWHKYMILKQQKTDPNAESNLNL